jgi:pantothenate kinase
VPFPAKHFTAEVGAGETAGLETGGTGWGILTILVWIISFSRICDPSETSQNNTISLD